MRTTCLALLIVFGVAAADDPGFTPLIPGPGLTGWKTKKEKESLDGKADAYKGRFKLADGVLTIDPKVKGDVVIETAKEYSGDVTIRFEFQPGAGCNNDLFFRGTKFDLKPPDVKNLKEGEWNRFEIVVTGDKAEFRNNGEAMKTLPAKQPKSPLGIRAEFGPVQFRNLRIKEGG